MFDEEAFFTYCFNNPLELDDAKKDLDMILHTEKPTMSIFGLLSKLFENIPRTRIIFADILIKVFEYYLNFEYNYLVDYYYYLTCNRLINSKTGYTLAKLLGIKFNKNQEYFELLDSNTAFKILSF